MLRKTALAAIAASFALVPAAHADQIPSGQEHVIMFVGGGYFPTISYVNAGDTLRFINTETSAVEIVGEDDSWTTGELQPEDEVTVLVVSDMALEFHDADDSDIIGFISFDAP